MVREEPLSMKTHWIRDITQCR